MINLKHGCFSASLLFTTLLSLFASLPAQSLAPLDVHPFISGDIGYRDLDFQDDYGGNVFKSSLPQTGFQIGLRFWDYFGVQLGYERSRREGRTARIGPNQVVLGRFIPPGGSEHHTTESGIQGQHFDVLFFVPTHPMTGLELLLGIGIVRTKLLHKDIVVGINDMTLLAPLSRTFRNKQTHYRVFGGIQKLFPIHGNRFINQFGVRALATWENTSQYRYERPLEIADSFMTAKNSYIFSLGLIFIH